LATENEGMTGWHWATCEGNLDILHKIWNWGEEKITTEDDNSNNNNNLFKSRTLSERPSDTWL